MLTGEGGVAVTVAIDISERHTCDSADTLKIPGVRRHKTRSLSVQQGRSSVADRGEQVHVPVAIGVDRRQIADVIRQPIRRGTGLKHSRQAAVKATKGRVGDGLTVLSLSLVSRRDALKT